jgi:hypothetical protein
MSEDPIKKFELHCLQERLAALCREFDIDELLFITTRHQYKNDKGLFFHGVIHRPGKSSTLVNGVYDHINQVVKNANAQKLFELEGLSIKNDKP